MSRAKSRRIFRFYPFGGDHGDRGDRGDRSLAQLTCCNLSNIVVAALCPTSMEHASRSQEGGHKISSHGKHRAIKKEAMNVPNSLNFIRRGAQQSVTSVPSCLPVASTTVVRVRAKARCAIDLSSHLELLYFSHPQRYNS